MMGLIANSATASDTIVDQGRQASVTELGKTSRHYYHEQLHQQPQRSLENKKTIRNHQHGLWLYEVSIGLNSDYDSDGHYSNFSITLDFDTSVAASFVYAVLYVSIDNGPWNEYAVSGNFTVNGTDSNDAYTIHTTLDSGYPTGYYDHYVELYDAYTHEFLVSYGPHDSHYFHHLPFESSIHDHYTSDFSSTISLNFTGTGSTGPFSIGLLALLFGLRTVRIRRSPSKRKDQS